MTTLQLAQGIDAGYSWPIVTAEGDAADLPGYSVKCQVRRGESPPSTLLADLTASIPDSNVVVSWTAEESLAWTWDAGFSDVLLISPEERPVQFIWAGKVTVNKAVTHV